MHCHEYVCQSDCQSDSLEARPAGLQSEAPYPFSNTKSDWWAGQESNLHSFRGGFTVRRSPDSNWQVFANREARSE